VTGRVAVSGQADDTSVAEQVVLAVDFDQLVPEIEIGSVVAVRSGNLGSQPCFPLAFLYDHDRVGDQGVAADMIKMKMRVDDDFDPCRVPADRFEPRADFFTRVEVERKEAGKTRSDPRCGVVLAVGMKPGVEQDGALGMLDQISGDRQVRPTLSAFHQPAEIAGQPAAGHGEKLYAQKSALLNVAVPIR